MASSFFKINLFMMLLTKASVTEYKTVYLDHENEINGLAAIRT